MRGLKSICPNASLVLTTHLKQRNFPFWTSYFVKYKDVINDQRGLSHFNWKVEDSNYHILRTGCWPYIKYHCTKRQHQDLTLEDKFFKIIKFLNLGLPCLAYGLGAKLLISYHEVVHTPDGSVIIYFLYEEDKSSSMGPWQRLNGIICVYKPPQLSMPHLRGTLTNNLIADLNDQFTPPKENLVTIKGSTASKLDVIVNEKLALHPLAIGKGFMKEDLKIRFVNHLASTTSGVCVLGLNKAANFATAISYSRLIRTYRLSGLLGLSTINFHFRGKPVERSAYSHVTYGHLEKILMTIQAIHQKRAMEFLGSNLQSQETYEALSEEGIVRPGKDSYPLAYSLKCIEFKPPDFTIEVSCINENEDFLRKMIHDIGLFLKTNSTTTKVQCIRYGPFTVDHALLRKHWRLDYVLENIYQLRPLLTNIIPDTPSLKVIEDSTLSV